MEVTKIEVYTDGSFHDTSELKNKTYGSIYIPSFDSTDYASFTEWAFFTDNPVYVQSRNVGGEVMAAEFAINLICLRYDQLCSMGHEPQFEIHMYYDYEGVGKWLTGEWRAKKELTQAYNRYVKNLLKDRHIELFPHHVRGHAGNAGNERADHLACEAYHSERCYDANSFVEGVLK